MLRQEGDDGAWLAALALKEEGLGLRGRAWGLGFRFLDVRLKFQGSGLGLRVQSVGQSFRVLGAGVRV